MTEYSKVPNKDLVKIFNGEDMAYISRIINKVDPKFKNLHQDIEQDLEVLK